MKFSETKRNFTCDETKFRFLYCFAKHTKFCETDDKFRIVSCFAKLKKHAKLETLDVTHRSTVYPSTFFGQLVKEQKKDVTLALPFILLLFFVS
jgi:hypothetical protein